VFVASAGVVFLSTFPVRAHSREHHGELCELAYLLLVTASAPLAFFKRRLGIAIFVAGAVCARPVIARVAVLAIFRGVWGIARACRRRRRRRYLGEGSGGRQSPQGEQEGLSDRGPVSPWGV
jgi:hypothetical protein